MAPEGVVRVKNWGLVETEDYKFENEKKKEKKQIWRCGFRNEILASARGWHVIMRHC